MRDMGYGAPPETSGVLSIRITVEANTREEAEQGGQLLFDLFVKQYKHLILRPLETSPFPDAGRVLYLSRFRSVVFTRERTGEELSGGPVTAAAFSEALRQ